GIMEEREIESKTLGARIVDPYQDYKFSKLLPRGKLALEEDPLLKQSHNPENQEIFPDPASISDGVRAVYFALSLLEKGPSIYMHHLTALPIKELSSVPSCIRIRPPKKDLKKEIEMHKFGRVRILCYEFGMDSYDMVVLFYWRDRLDFGGLFPLLQCHKT
ncbi:purine permease 10, partial [Prunus dulcis]